MSSFVAQPLDKLLNRRNPISRIEKLEDRTGARPSAVVVQLLELVKDDITVFPSGVVQIGQYSVQAVGTEPAYEDQYCKLYFYRNTITGDYELRARAQIGNDQSQKTLAAFALGLEDFTTYTQVDAPGRITASASRLEVTNGDRDETYYAYDDKGLNAINEVNIDFEMYLSVGSVTNEQVYMAVTNTVDTVDGFAATDMSVALSVAGGTPYIYLVRGAVAATQQSVALSDGTIYYCTLQRSAGSDTATLDIYSDDARTVQLGGQLSLSGYGAGTQYQYVHGVNVFNSGTSGLSINGYVQNMRIA